MKDKRFSVDASIMTLDDGTEIYYCELGKENEEVLVSPAHYFITWTPVLEYLAMKYHVFGILMRFDGLVTCLNVDGSTNWGRQWGDDVYRVMQKLGIQKFHYLGKCHGTIPGWALVKDHPEVLKTFCSYFMAPHLCPQVSNKFIGTQQKEGFEAATRMAMRHTERLPIKMNEIASLGGSLGNSPDVTKYSSAPELIWENKEACEEDLKNTDVPICLLFGTEDVFFQDHYDSNLKAMKTIKRCRTIILQGEKHLVEMDCPDRLANECMAFIEDCKHTYD